MEELNLIRRWWLEWRNRWNSIAGSAILRLGDASGESKLSVRNSDDQEVFYVRSDGRTSVEPGEGADGEALLRGGGRSLLGDLTVAEGKTIDGVDISAFKSSVDSWQNTHVQTGSDPHPQYITASTAASTYARSDTSVNGTNGLSGGGALGTGTNTLNLSVNAGYAFSWTAQHSFGEGAKIAAGKSLGFADAFGAVDAEVKRVSANTLALGDGDQLQSTDFSSGAYGYRIDASGNAEFNNIRARGEFAASVFRRSEISAAAGTLGVFPGASVVHVDFTTPGSVGSDVSAFIRNETPTSGTASFSGEDILQVKTWNGTAFVNAYLKVNASPAPVVSTGYTKYSLLLMNGSVSAAVAAGTAIVKTGTSSGGAALLLSADGSVGGAPNMTLQTHTGVPWEPTVISRFGNLSGITDSVFGALSGYGTYVAGNAYITGSINASGGQISGVLGIGTSGEIRQGTGSLTASPATFTGTRMWNDGGVGRIGGYNSGALQWYAGTDGRLYAAEGNVVLDKDGLRISTDASSNYSNQKGLSFVSNMHLASNSRFGVYSSTDLVIDYSVLSLKNTGGNTGTYAIDISARDNVTLYGASSVEMNIYGASFRLKDGSVQISCGVYAFNGLNVGTATGAATGEIKASAGISATTGTFSSTLGVTGTSTLAALSATTGTFSGGLNVGTATGATAGQVKASAGISGTTGTFSGDVSANDAAFSGGLNVGSATGAATGEIKASAGISATTGTFSSSSNPRAIIESTGSGAASRSFLRFKGPASSTDFISVGYYADGSPTRMQIMYGGESVSFPIMSLTSTNRVGINISIPSYTLDVDGNVRFTEGLNVGTATGAAAGAIKASGDISASDAVFTGGLNVGSATGATGGSAKVQLRMALNGATLNTQATMNVCGQVNAFPAASGLAGEAAIRVRGGNASGTSESGTVLDISASGVSGQQGGWVQARNSGDYSLNYLLLLNPNGGNVAIGSTSASYALDVDGSGRMRTSLIVGGDIGGGLASHVIVTNGNNVAANSTGTGTIKFKGATSRDSSGFIKIYVGTTAYWVPFFSAVTG